jgi:RNA polymerase-binding protein DksA
MAKFVDAAKSRLLERRAALSRKLAAHDEEERELDAEQEQDWPDRAALREGEEVLHTLSDRERAELVEIDAALQRIEADTYGTCESCDETIARERLLAVPYARRCFDCQNLDGKRKAS